MFLDDKIVNLVRAARPQTMEESIIIVRDITIMCNDKLRLNILSDNNDHDLKTSIKNVFNLYDSAVRTLKKEGIDILEEGGYRSYLMLDKNVSEIILRLNL